MQVFIVGATGYIGGTVAQRLLQSGHRVSGLARNQEKAQGLADMGIIPVIGTFDDKDVLARAAAGADATINVGDSDRLDVAETLIGALTGSGKILLHTSGASIVVDDAKGDVAGKAIFKDDAPYTPMDHRLVRIAVDERVRMAGVQDGIRAAVICPTMVYGQGRGLHRESDQIPKITAKSKQRAAGVHIGRGINTWSNVFIDDLADLYLLALEKAPAGAFFFAENGESTMKALAESISRALGFEGRTEAWPLDEAMAELGPWPMVALAPNCRVRAVNARRLLGWRPKGPSLAEFLEAQGAI
jgi:nucleoside-diphosphate-sugar epimerase